MKEYVVYFLDGLMVIKKHESETPKERRKRRIRNRLVYNDWGLNGFVQMLIYKCLRFGKELYIIDESDTTCGVLHERAAIEDVNTFGPI